MGIKGGGVFSMQKKRCALLMVMCCWIFEKMVLGSTLRVFPALGLCDGGSARPGRRSQGAGGRGSRSVRLGVAPPSSSAAWCPIGKIRYESFGIRARRARHIAVSTCARRAPTSFPFLAGMTNFDFDHTFADGSFADACAHCDVPAFECASCWTDAVDPAVLLFVHTYFGRAFRPLIAAESRWLPAVKP